MRRGWSLPCLLSLSPSALHFPPCLFCCCNNSLFPSVITTHSEQRPLSIQTVHNSCQITTLFYIYQTACLIQSRRARRQLNSLWYPQIDQTIRVRLSWFTFLTRSGSRSPITSTSQRVCVQVTMRPSMSTTRSYSRLLSVCLLFPSNFAPSSNHGCTAASSNTAGFLLELDYCLPTLNGCTSTINATNELSVPPESRQGLRISSLQ